MLKKIYGSAVFGVEAHTITIEVNVDYGIGYHLVGLPDNAIKESNFRIAVHLLDIFPASFPLSELNFINRYLSLYLSSNL